MACEELPFQGLLFIIAVSRLFIFLPGAIFSQENSKGAPKEASFREKDINEINLIKY